MINAIIGEIVSSAGQWLVVRAGGVEYSLVISSQTAARLARLDSTQRKEVRILTRLQVREDGMALYGFFDEDERRLFGELVKVPGIGPRQAVKILSGMSVRDFVFALDTNDLKGLSKIPGLGVKTAQKIVLALRDRLVSMDLSQGPAAQAASASKEYEDLIVALSDMGYERRRIVDAITALEKSHASELAGKSLREREQTLFRLALGSL